MPNLEDYITQQLAAKKPFVVYRKPNSEKVKVVMQQNSVVHKVNDYTETGFIFSPFDASSPSILIKQDEVYETVYDVSSFDRKESKNIKDSSISQKGDYLNLIQKSINTIKNSEIQKIVVSREIKVNFSQRPYNFFQHLLCLYPNAFCYLWYHPKIGMWSGATPEVLAHVENNRIITNSLAGTQLADGDEIPSWGNKELDEQKIVTNFIVDALKGKVADLNISETTSIRAGALWHLRTRISGKMKNNFKEIIKALHPTPATCGMPKDATKKFILESEGYNRLYYTGFLGELNMKQETNRTSSGRNQENRAYKIIKKSSFLYVNLRCIQLKEKTALIYVGGGITQDSVPEKEWDETVSKSATMLAAITNN